MSPSDQVTVTLKRWHIQYIIGVLGKSCQRSSKEDRECFEALRSEFYHHEQEPLARRASAPRESKA